MNGTLDYQTYFDLTSHLHQYYQLFISGIANEILEEFGWKFASKFGCPIFYS